MPSRPFIVALGYLCSLCAGVGRATPRGQSDATSLVPSHPLSDLALRAWQESRYADADIVWSRCTADLMDGVEPPAWASCWRHGAASRVLLRHTSDVRRHLVDIPARLTADWTFVKLALSVGSAPDSEPLSASLLLGWGMLLAAGVDVDPYTPLKGWHGMGNSQDPQTAWYGLEQLALAPADRAIEVRRSLSAPNPLVDVAEAMSWRSHLRLAAYIFARGSPRKISRISPRPQGLERARAIGDWWGTTWAAVLGLQRYLRLDEAQPLTADETWRLYSTARWFSAGEAESEGAFGLRESASIADFITGDGEDADRVLNLPGAHVLPHTLPAAVSEECSRAAEAFEALWHNAPDSIWRTDYTLWPDTKTPVRGAPQDPTYRALASAARALPSTCRQAIGAVRPVRLARRDLVLDADTAIVDLVLDQPVATVVALLGREGAPPELIVHRVADDEWRIASSRAWSAARDRSGRTPFPAADAYQIYRSLLAPIVGLEEYPRWIVCVRWGDTPLPVEAWVMADPETTRAADRGPAFVANRHSIRYATSLRDALSWSVRPSTAPIERTITIFDPIFHDADERCVDGNCADLPDISARQKTFGQAEDRLANRHIRPFPVTTRDLTRIFGPETGDRARSDVLDPPAAPLDRLPGSQRDAVAIAALSEDMGWDVLFLTGREAREDALRIAWRAPRPTALAVSTHAGVPSRVRRGMNQAFGLVFAPSPGHDGLLELPEIDALPIAHHIDLVLLGSCSGAQPVRIGGLPPRSLGEALRQRGARTVLAWWLPVDDERAGPLTEQVLRRSIEHREPLDVAVKTVLARVRREHPHPADWLGLTVLGPGEPILAGDFDPPTRSAIEEDGIALWVGAAALVLLSIIAIGRRVIDAGVRRRRDV